MINFQVSLPTSHSIPDQLLPLHADLRLHLQHRGQVHRHLVRNLAPATGRVAGRGAPNAPDDAGVDLPSPSRIGRLGLQALHFQVVLVGDVALDILVHDGYLDLRSHVVRGGEECSGASQATNLGYTKVQHSGN